MDEYWWFIVVELHFWVALIYIPRFGGSSVWNSNELPKNVDFPSTCNIQVHISPFQHPQSHMSIILDYIQLIISYIFNFATIRDFLASHVWLSEGTMKYHELSMSRHLIEYPSLSIHHNWFILLSHWISWLLITLVKHYFPILAA